MGYILYILTLISLCACSGKNSSSIYVERETPYYYENEYYQENYYDRESDYHHHEHEHHHEHSEHHESEHGGGHKGH